MPLRFCWSFCLALFSVVSLVGQPANQTKSVIKKITLYYNGAAELTARETAIFKRVAEINITAMVLHGVFQDYDLNDQLIAEGYFNEGHKFGLQTKYFKDRSIKSSVDISENDFVIWQMKSEAKEDIVVNGTGKFTVPFYYVTGTVYQPRWKQGILDGEFLFGKRVGVWSYLDMAKNKLDEEFYEKGKFLHRTHYELASEQILDYRKEITLSLGNLLEESMALDPLCFQKANDCMEKAISYPANFNRPATFAGGLKHLLLLIRQQLELPEGEALVIIAMIDERGELVRCTVDDATGSKVFNLTLTNVVKSHEKKFFPAIKNGKPVASKLILPVYGGAEGQKAIGELPYDFIQEQN